MFWAHSPGRPCRWSGRPCKGSRKPCLFPPRHREDSRTSLAPAAEWVNEKIMTHVDTTTCTHGSTKKIISMTCRAFHPSTRRDKSVVSDVINPTLPWFSQYLTSHPFYHLAQDKYERNPSTFIRKTVSVSRLFALLKYAYQNYLV